jgi:CheY-like chemotaxis protein
MRRAARDTTHGREGRLNALRDAMHTILLVEDNEMNRDMLSRRLERRGYRVVLAMDGQSGVEMAGTEAPDLVLMDMSLPVLDGWEATRRLKADPATAHLPVIALTAHAMSGDRDRAIAAGCDDYDTKPIELPRLLGKIEALLGASAGADVPTDG